MYTERPCIPLRSLLIVIFPVTWLGVKHKCNAAHRVLCGKREREGGRDTSDRLADKLIDRQRDRQRQREMERGGKGRERGRDRDRQATRERQVYTKRERLTDRHRYRQID